MLKEEGWTHAKDSDMNPYVYKVKSRKGVELDLNGNLKTLHLAHTQFYYLPGFYPKTGFLRNHHLAMGKKDLESKLF